MCARYFGTFLRLYLLLCSQCLFHDFRPTFRLRRQLPCQGAEFLTCIPNAMKRAKVFWEVWNYNYFKVFLTTQKFWIFLFEEHNSPNVFLHFFAASHIFDCTSFARTTPLQSPWHRRLIAVAATRVTSDVLPNIVTTCNMIIGIMHKRRQPKPPWFHKRNVGVELPSISRCACTRP